MKHTPYVLVVFMIQVLLVSQAFSQRSLGPENYKYETSKKIYDRISSIAKDDRMAPQLVLIAKGFQNGSLAWYNYYSKKIFLQEETYDICMEMGRDSMDALAFILGHELSHFFDKHDFLYDFAFNYGDLNIGKQITGESLIKIDTSLARFSHNIKLIEKKDIQLVQHFADSLRVLLITEDYRTTRGAQESQSDHDGAFHSFVAGYYNSIDIVPRLLDSIYATIRDSVHKWRKEPLFVIGLSEVAQKDTTEMNKLPDDVLADYTCIENGYPSKLDRKLIVTRLDTAFKKLRPVWEAAVKLILTGNYKEAAECYEYIAINGYPSREVFNNAGVAKLLSAINELGTKVKFVYPTILDVQSGLAKKGAKGFGITPPNIVAILTEAKADFDHALTRDETYATARINLACTLDLLGEKKARLTAEQAEIDAEAHEPNAVINAKIAQAIIAANQDRIDDAKAIFTELKGRSALAAINLDRINGKPDATLGLVSGSETPSINKEYIAEMKPVDWAKTDPHQMTYVSENGVELYSQRTDKFLGINVSAFGKETTLLSTPPYYKESSGRGIIVGSKTSEVRKLYGDPQFTLQTANGTYLVYKDKSQIIFDVDPENNVRGWTLYSSK